MSEVIEKAIDAICFAEGLTGNVRSMNTHDRNIRRKLVVAIIQTLIDSSLCNPDCEHKDCEPCTIRRKTKARLHQLLQEGK